MSRAAHKLAVVVGWLLPAACAVYDESLLRGGDGEARARGGSGSGATSAGNTSGAGESANASGGSSINLPNGGSGAGDSAGSTANGGSAPGTSGTNGEGGTPQPGAGGTPGGEAGAGLVPIGGSGSGLVFDTMEDGNNVFFLTSAVRGRWYLSHDSTAGTQTSIGMLIDIIPDGREQSTRAVHVVSSGFSSWGASVGFTFEDNASGDRLPFDASGYAAIAFFARVESGSATAVRVNFPDMNTDPMGGACLDADAGTGDCLDHFGKDLVLTTDFTQHVLVFAQLGQKGWGKLEPALDASKLLGMEVSWAPNTSIDVWIDDVEFVE